jgi:hypothetical protein
MDNYISKGIGEEPAEISEQECMEIVSAVARDDFSVVLTFDNGEVRVLDMKPRIKEKTAFAFLSDIGSFKGMYLDNCQCVSWDSAPNNRASLTADLCYLESTPFGSPKNA